MIENYDNEKCIGFYIDLSTIYKIIKVGIYWSLFVLPQLLKPIVLLKLNLDYKLEYNIHFRLWHPSWYCGYDCWFQRPDV